MKGNTCYDHLGYCGPPKDCDQRCKGLHSGGKGFCDVKEDDCICSFECSLPKDLYEDNLGICGGGGSCDQKCKDKHKDGIGYCFDDLCFCNYHYEPPSLVKPKMFHGI